jgi:4'-phosphopantetheinyl transferase
MFWSVYTLSVIDLMSESEFMPHLPPDEIHLWFIPQRLEHDSQENEWVLQFEALLSHEEQHRYQRFQFAADRRRFLLTRAAIRTLLSLYDSLQQPYSWQFGRNLHGRPELVPEPAHQLATLSFNISHSDGVIVIAFSAEGRVGVDIESIDITRRSIDLAKRYFSPAEYLALVKLPIEEQEQRFFDLWTLKEAFVKACGAGLKIPLRWFTFLFPSAQQVTVTFQPELAESAENWQFWQLQYNQTYRVALALTGCPGKVKKLRMFELELPATARDLDLPIKRLG